MERVERYLPDMDATLPNLATRPGSGGSGP